MADLNSSQDTDPLNQILEAVEFEEGLGSDLLCSDFRKEISFNGFRPDLLKSGVQKYLRRGELDQALWCGIELDLFCLSSKRGETIRTNFIHRLMIIYAEDIGIGELGKWKQLDTQVKQLFRLRKARQPFGSVRAQEMQIIVEILWLLSEGTHSRQFSHLNVLAKANELPKLLEFVQRYHPHLIEEFDEIQDHQWDSLTSKMEDEFEGDEEIWKTLDLSDSELEVRDLIWKLLRSLSQQKLIAFYWCRQLIQELKQRSIRSARRYGRYKSEYLIFKILELDSKKLSTKRAGWFMQYHQIARDWFHEINTKEEFLFYFMLIHLLIFPQDLVAPKEHRCPLDWKYHYRKNLNEGKIELDDYVIDIHTAEGRAQGKNAVDFAFQGAVVSNEWEGTDVDFKDLYMEYKVFSFLEYDWDQFKFWKINPCISTGPSQEIDRDDPPEMESQAFDGPAEMESQAFDGPAEMESQAFEFRVRIQLTCSRSRPDTYFAWERSTGDPVFVKGPYPSSESIAFQINELKINYPGVYPLKMKTMMLIPDLFPEGVPLGCRNSVDRTQKHLFLVVEDLNRGQDYPTRIHQSKLWPPTEVVDWAKVQRCQVPDCELVRKDPKGFESWVLALIFRWVIGIPDCARRNFIYLPEQHRVISVDEENWDCEAKIYNCLKEKTCSHIRVYLTQNWDQISEVLKTWNCDPLHDLDQVLKIFKP